MAVNLTPGTELRDVPVNREVGMAGKILAENRPWCPQESPELCESDAGVILSPLLAVS